MREFLLCKSCFRSKMQVVKVVEHGRTLQLECPNCGALDYIPVWGRRFNKPLTAEQKRERLGLRKRELSATLKNIASKTRGR